jgi:hypothetical protein
VEELWGKPLDVDLEAGLMNDNGVSNVAALPMLNTSEVARLDSAAPVCTVWNFFLHLFFFHLSINPYTSVVRCSLWQ